MPTHYHVTSWIPGYMPNDDNPYTSTDVREALTYLADELDRVADNLAELEDIERENARTGEDVESADALDIEADRVWRIATELRTLEDRAPLPNVSSVTIDGEPTPVDYLSTYGLTIYVDEGRALPYAYGMTVCEEDCPIDD